MKYALMSALTLAMMGPTLAEEPPQYTIRDCISILTGLNQLDTSKAKLPPPARDAISHDMFVLVSVQNEAQAANRRIQMEVRGDTDGDLNQRQLGLVDQRINDYLDRPCKADLDKLNKGDLESDLIPPSAIANLWKIINR